MILKWGRFMNNEIKEILELLKEDLYIPQEDNREYKLLDKGDDKTLLDYITNLQKDLRDACEVIEQLKKDKLKAIEYIKEKARNNCWIDQYESCDLINILKGEGK